MDRRCTAGITTPYRSVCWKHSAGVCVLLGVLTSWSSPGEAQLDSTFFHATLQEWAEHSWIKILDREGAQGGRLGSEGILQRFHEDIDGEYQLDKIASRFGLAEEFEWYSRPNGFRWWAGSTTARELAIRGELRTAVQVGGNWAMGVRVDLEENTEASRGLVRVSFRRTWNSGVYGFAEGTLDAVKPGSDFEFGAGWQSPRNPNHKATISLAILDWWNDFIYLNLNAAHQGQVDSTLEYVKQPLALRGSVALPVGRSVRFEGYGAVMRPTTILAYAELDPQAGFRQTEQVGYLGGLVEWAVVPTVRVGAFGTYIEASSERYKLSSDVAVDEYKLNERTTQLGGLVMVRLPASLSIEGWVVRGWRPEKRDYLDSSQSDVDYEDRAWSAQLVVGHFPDKGFRGDVGIVFDRRDVVRGAGQIPSSGGFNQNNYRARFDIGWRFAERAFFLVGWGIDLDGDGVGRYSGGGRGRFAMYW